MSARIFSPSDVVTHASVARTADQGGEHEGARRRGGWDYFQVKSTRRSWAQLGSSVPFASSDPRGSTDS